jgi:hypothetical protein
MQTESLLWAASLVVAVGAILGFIKVWVVNPLSSGLDERVVDRVDERLNEKLSPINDTLEQIRSDVRDIRHEVNLNSGESLKDQVLKIRDELAQERVSQAEKVGELKGRLDEHLHIQQGQPRPE